MITLKNINFDYEVFEKEAGLLGTLKDFFKRQSEKKRVLSNINLTIQQGEAVGLLGKNGAGKTTLIKMMTGILNVSEGELSVLGEHPFHKRARYLKEIGVVMGQKSQLIWDLPPIDTLNMLRVIYEIEQVDFVQRLDELVQLLEVTDLLKVPVRKLSLGERIKFELICALIHAPKVLFLDEPTIGLDIASQRSVHQFLRKLNETQQTTIILTSHYMQDIEAVCNRVVILVKGHISEDCALTTLTDRYKQVDDVKITFLDEVPESLLEYQVGEHQVQLHRTQLDALAATISLSEIEEYTIEKQGLEEIIYRIYSEDTV